MKTKRTMKSIAAAALALTLVAAPAVQEISPLFSGTSLGIVASAATNITVNGDTDFDDLNAALADSATVYNINVTANATGNITVPKGKTVTITVADGVTLTGGATAYEHGAGTGHTTCDTILNFGTLTIKGAGSIVTAADTAVANMPGGTVTIEGCTIKGDGVSDHAYIMENEGTMTIKGSAKVENAGGTPGHNGYFPGAAKASHYTDGSTTAVLNIEGGTLTGTVYAIKNDFSAKTVVSGGTLSANGYVLANADQMEVTGGTINAGAASAIWNQKGKSGADLGSESAKAAGTLKISGGTFNGSNVAIKAAWGAMNNEAMEMGSIKITGGTFKLPILEAGAINVGGVSTTLTASNLSVGGTTVVNVTSEDTTANKLEILKPFIEEPVKVVKTGGGDPVELGTFCSAHEDADGSFAKDADGHYLECGKCVGKFHVDSVSGHTILGAEAHDIELQRNDANQAEKAVWTVGTDGIPTKVELPVKCSDCSWTGNVPIEVTAENPIVAGAAQNGKITSSSVDITDESDEHYGQTKITYTAQFAGVDNGSDYEVANKVERYIDTAKADEEGLVNQAKTVLSGELNGANGIVANIYPEISKNDSGAKIEEKIQTWLRDHSKTPSGIFGDSVTVSLGEISWEEPTKTSVGKVKGMITLTSKADPTVSATLEMNAKYADTSGILTADEVTEKVYQILAEKPDTYYADAANDNAAIKTAVETELYDAGYTGWAVTIDKTYAAPTENDEGSITVKATVNASGDATVTYDVKDYSKKLDKLAPADDVVVEDVADTITAVFDTTETGESKVSVSADVAKNDAALADFIKTTVGADADTTVTVASEGEITYPGVRFDDPAAKATKTVKITVSKGEAEPKEISVVVDVKPEMGDIFFDGELDDTDVYMLKSYIKDYNS